MIFPELQSLPKGFYHFKRLLSDAQQRRLMEDVRAVIRDGPLFYPIAPFGNNPRLRFRITSCGILGWVSDAEGYRYTTEHPVTHRPWPPMPPSIREMSIEMAARAGCADFNPETCIINHYADPTQTLGLHQDRSENNLKRPIISASMGASGIFLLGGFKRTDPVERHEVGAGDGIVMADESRLRFHGFEGTFFGERWNLTVRQVN